MRKNHRSLGETGDHRPYRAIRRWRISAEETALDDAVAAAGLTKSLAHEARRYARKSAMRDS